MISAMKDYLPEFRKYLRRKGELMGSKNGLRWYDMYAPIGKTSKEFSIPEAQEYILKNFATFDNPQIKVLLSLRKPLYNTPRVIKNFEEDEIYLKIPI